MKTHTSYLDQSLNPRKLRELIKRIAPRMRALKKELNFDAIAFQGYSGAGVAYPLSYSTGIPLMLVRKVIQLDMGDLRPLDTCHGSVIEGKPDNDVLRYVILDDITVTGRTIQKMISTVRGYCERNHPCSPQPKCVGIMLYGFDPGPKRFRHEDGTELKIYHLCEAEEWQ